MECLIYTHMRAHARAYHHTQIQHWDFARVYMFRRCDVDFVHPLTRSHTCNARNLVSKEVIMR